MKFERETEEERLEGLARQAEFDRRKIQRRRIMIMAALSLVTTGVMLWFGNGRRNRASIFNHERK